MRMECDVLLLDAGMFRFRHDTRRRQDCVETEMCQIALVEMTRVWHYDDGMCCLNDEK